MDDPLRRHCLKLDLSDDEHALLLMAAERFGHTPEEVLRQGLVEMACRLERLQEQAGPSSISGLGPVFGTAPAPTTA